MRLSLSISLNNSSKGISSITPALINDGFKRRVESRNGVFEAKSCLTTQLNALKNIA